MSIIKILGDKTDQRKVIDFCKKNGIAYATIDKTLEDLNLKVVDISKPIKSYRINPNENNKV